MQPDFLTKCQILTISVALGVRFPDITTSHADAYGHTGLSAGSALYTADVERETGHCCRYLTGFYYIHITPEC